MTGLPIPTPATDPLNAADWLELRALIADDGNASSSDLRRALVGLGLEPEDYNLAVDPREREEVLASDVFAEIDDRAAACPECYPFVHEGSQLQVRRDIQIWGYVFCLLLSYEGADRSDAPRRLTELFEEISELAAQKYVSGPSVKFGFPRRVLPGAFIEALNAVCRQLREGDRAKTRPGSEDAKDARLDIVAWRPFPDQRKAQLILFGQCGAGGNWDEKLSDLQPKNFTDLYWADPPAVDPIKGFFTPFRVSPTEWYTKAKYGGVLFDRCRIAHLVCGMEPPDGVTAWIETTLDRLRSGRARVTAGRLRIRMPRRRRARRRRATVRR